MTKLTPQPVPGEPEGVSPRTVRGLTPSGSPASRRTFWLASVSAVLLWAAFPPLGLSWLAWIAPVGWLLLIRQEKMDGRRPYLTLWIVNVLQWLAVMQGVRLAHPILHLGWLALALYLAVYPTLFVALARIAVQRWKVPLVIAAPTIWTGLELFRSQFLTGFALALLGHTQVRWPMVIQIADIVGAYGVSFLVMLVAAGLASLSSEGRINFRPALLALATLVAVLCYGQMRMQQSTNLVANPSNSKQRSLKVALIQHSIDTIFAYDPDRNHQTFMKYYELTLDTLREHSGVDLVVWPESMLTANSPAMFFQPDKVSEQFRDGVQSRELAFRNKVIQLMADLNQRRDDSTGAAGKTMLLAGCDAVEVQGERPRVFNSALMLAPDGTIQGRYSKMHLVMFGEYIPLAETFPILYRITPMPMGVSPGQQPEMFDVGDVYVSTSVCFESTVPHLLRRHFNELSLRHSVSPDILVNVTNDGWFWGSSILDLHFACSVFRAVEVRRPLLIAANTGISAALDDCGRVLEELPRRQPGAIVLRVPVTREAGDITWYARCGDWFAWLCFLATFGVLLGEAGRIKKLRGKKI